MRRYCIDTASTTSEQRPDICEGSKERNEECIKPDCPQHIMNDLPPLCMDLDDDCDIDNVDNKKCFHKDHTEWMKMNCKNTCDFCRRMKVLSFFCFFAV